MVSKFVRLIVLNVLAVALLPLLLHSVSETALAQAPQGSPAVSFISFGPNGSQAAAANAPVTMVKANKSLSTMSALATSSNATTVWVDEYSKTYLMGWVLYSPNTCTLASEGTWSAVSAPKDGTLSYSTLNFPMSSDAGKCAGTVLPYNIAKYTWTNTSNTTVLQDPFVLRWSGGQYSETSNWVAELSHIVISPITGNTCGGTSQPTATLTLVNPPPIFNSYTWTMTGAAGTAAFSNGQQTITTGSNSTTIQYLAPSSSINISVTASVPFSNPLTFGPLANSYCATPNISSVSPNFWFAGKSYPVTITGTGFNSTASASCPMTSVAANTGSGSLGISNVTVVSPTQITATLAPGASDPTEAGTITAGNCPYNGAILGAPSIQCTADTIGCNGNTITSPQNVVVGQSVELNTTPTTAQLAALPGAPSFSSNTWTVSGTNIGGYVAFPVENQQTLASAFSTILHTPNLTTYWLQPSDSVPVTYQYCVGGDCSLTANATFNVIGPSATITTLLTTPAYGAWSVAPVIPGCDDPNGLPRQALDFGLTTAPYGCDSIIISPGIVFEATDISNADNGTFQWVQLAPSDVATYVNPDLTEDQEISGGGQMTLDTVYPYPPDPDPNNPSIPRTTDSPSQPLLNNWISTNRAFTAIMYLEWVPDQNIYPASIEVPLGYVTWSINGTASSNLISPPSWSITSQLPTTVEYTSSTDPNFNTITQYSYYGLPIWSGPVTSHWEFTPHN